MAPLIPKLPLPLSDIVAIDEIYVKIKGKWHCLFTAIDGKHGFVIIQHLSKHRDAKAALTILQRVIEQYDGKKFTLVTYKALIYEVAVHAAKVFLNANIDHHQIKGLFPYGIVDYSNEVYRPYKNIVERFFGTYKSYYKRHKSFSSFEGAISHAILYQLYFNYLKPHDSFGGKPPLQITDSTGRIIEN
ncbi:DDE-type integrase/transposase/recombinase [Anoxybacter fermentans]|uniref:DDE-type integrase/transposase/recombinase n=1 Tax=Anoxybacter fermentans TaxID=1323375 RepID=UPI0013E03293|nr:DDE-type integrase/transposase/recombinase [Anoxybacter fermentans]